MTDAVISLIEHERDPALHTSVASALGHACDRRSLPALAGLSRVWSS